MPSHRRMMMAAAGAGSPDIPVTTNLVAWYRADKGVGVTGADVDTWDDSDAQSGPFQLTDVGGNKPVLVASVINGHPVIRFTSANSDSLENVSFSLAVPYHIFMVFDPTYASGDIYYNGAAADDNIGMSFTSNANEITATSPTAGNLDIASNAPHLIQNMNDGETTAYIQLDDDAPVTGTDPGSSGFAVLDVGHGNNTNHAEGDIAELAFYSAEVTGGDLTSLENYFNTRYSLW